MTQFQQTQIQHPQIEAINDFVVKFANVNGSGSASANELFAKAILRMGVPVSPRNIFPSNIQGLPTWYEVRVCERGWLGRRGGVDLMVAMNPQTWDADIAEIETGGYLFYDNSKPLPKSKFRDDIHVLGVPLTEICNATYSDPRQRQLFKNIMYVGVLSALLDVDVPVIETLIAEQYKGKEKLLKPNIEALHLGRDWALQHLSCPIGLRVRKADAVGDRIFVEGNAAAALGCVYGGATVCAWYPITPSSSLAEAFQKYCQTFRVDADTGENRFAIIQAEDEIASIGMVVGAGWNGARAFTATSGPGISLMNEFIGLAYFAEIPATIIDVQRGGPSTGMPTRTQQSDILAAAYASHGDTKHILLFPEDPHECFAFCADALDLADRLQTPVFVMTDLDIGMNQRLCAPFVWDDTRVYDRGKVLDRDALEAGMEFARYKDIDGDGIPYRTYPGTHPEKGAYFTRGTSRNPQAQYSERGADYIYNMQRLLKKFDTAKTLVPQPLLSQAEVPSRFGAIHFGSTSPAMQEAIVRLQEQDVPLDTLRVRAFPFPASVREFVDAHESVFVIEQNRDGQLRTLLINEFEIDPARLIAVLHYDGTPITARFIGDAIQQAIGRSDALPGRAGMTDSAVQTANAKDRVELANRLLSQHRYGTPEHERGYTLMREAAEAPGGAWAQWLLGAYHLQVIQRPQSQASAAHWLRQAAAVGVPPAIERLADMSLDGIAMPFSLADAMQGLRTLAERGHAPSAWQLAYLSDRPDAPDTGVSPATLLLRACALGFGPAYYSLGLRFATGNGVARDPVLGRALLLRAADAGFRDAADAADELAPEGGEAAETLRASLKTNLAAAQPMLAAVGRGDAVSAHAIDPMLPKLESHLAAAVQPIFFVDAQGRACVRDAGRRASAAAVDWQWTTGLPKVGIAADFADREECAWLINKVAGSMLRPEQIARQHSANTDSELKQFNGHVRPLKMLDTDPVMRLLQRRIVETLAWRPTDMEPCSIISYGPGHEYLPHCDFFTEEQIALNREHTGDLGGQRVATFLAYLRAPDRGGETEYPHGGLLVRGRRGMAVVHYNIADGAPDPASLHAGRPVLEGEKWLWRSTLREHSMYA